MALGTGMRNEFTALQSKTAHGISLTVLKCLGLTDRALLVRKAKLVLEKRLAFFLTIGGKNRCEYCPPKRCKNLSYLIETRVAPATSSAQCRLLTAASYLVAATSKTAYHMNCTKP